MNNNIQTDDLRSKTYLDDWSRRASASASCATILNLLQKSSPAFPLPTLLGDRSNRASSEFPLMIGTSSLSWKLTFGDPRAEGGAANRGVIGVEGGRG